MPPFVQELISVPEPFPTLQHLLDLPAPLLLESTTRDGRLGRYSFLMADPVRWFERDTVLFGDDPFGEIAMALAEFSHSRIPGLPPFQGGVAGLLGYELGQAFERLPSPPSPRNALPVLAVGLYPWVIAWDHVQGRAWLIAHGDANHSAEDRAARVFHRLQHRSASVPTLPLSLSPPLPRFPCSTFSRESYGHAVERIIEYIRAGDLFQANLSQQFTLPTGDQPSVIYERLRQTNPAPFSAFFAHDDWAIASSSPERFLRVENGCVETRPIKGTRPRGQGRDEDQRLRDELAASEKDRAENIMIVDLLRNDLSRVCRPGSVLVPELCMVESYETVHHLVSTVTGELEPGRGVWDLLAATFPGGSITGAPKIRAMEVIAELEPVTRGPYCGSLFYAGFDGACDSNILIRTIVMRDGQCRIGAGGGVTALSDPVDEYEESLAKASGMLRAL